MKAAPRAWMCARDATELRAQVKEMRAAGVSPAAVREYIFEVARYAAQNGVPGLVGFAWSKLPATVRIDPERVATIFKEAHVNGVADAVPLELLAHCPLDDARFIDSLLQLGVRSRAPMLVEVCLQRGGSIDAASAHAIAYDSRNRDLHLLLIRHGLEFDGRAMDFARFAAERSTPFRPEDEARMLEFAFSLHRPRQASEEDRPEIAVGGL